MIGYKILTAKFISVRAKDRVNYLPDPSAPLPGPWINVPGLGAFVSREGEGLYCGGVPKDFHCVKLEVIDDAADQGIEGVSNYMRVRVIEVMQTLPAATTVGNIWAEQRAEITIPAAAKVGDIRADLGAKITLPAATTVRHICAYQGAEITLPAATTVGYIRAYLGAKITLPAAATVGDIRADLDAKITCRGIEAGGANRAG